MIPWELGVFVGIMSAIGGFLAGVGVGGTEQNTRWERQCVVQGVAVYVADDKGNSVWRWKVKDE